LICRPLQSLSGTARGRWSSAPLQPGPLHRPLAKVPPERAVRLLQTSELAPQPGTRTDFG
ncbi:MAG: hypothetical protein J2P27_12925, partial [Actinobacteria bacterium]|nr:hypothetical protein [Actinomycetota bacterium]